MKTVVILSGSPLCHNPRVIKEAAALAHAGYQVEVLGAWVNSELKERDLELLRDLPFTFTAVLDRTLDGWLWAHSRICVKAAHLWHQWTGAETRWQLGYVAASLLRVARRRMADLYIAHSEPGLWAISEISRLRAAGGPDTHFGVDMEDWFSEDLLPEARKHRPVKLLRGLEQKLLRACAHSTCPSASMSVALAKEYECNPPKVVYNAFPWADRKLLDRQFKDRRDPGIPSLHWYSQTLGPGRGLEELIDALPHVQHSLEIHLRGQPVKSFHQWLMLHLPEKWRSRVFVHDLVSNDALLSRIAEHDIGFAGEQKYCSSRDLTVTNKILHYLLAGLAVVASDTAGQREVAAQAGGSVRLYPAGDALALAAQLNALLASPEELQAAKSAALQAAEHTFCWERQVPVLLQSVERAMDH